MPPPIKAKGLAEKAAKKNVAAFTDADGLSE
jgi:hypothetical protein